MEEFKVFYNSDEYGVYTFIIHYHEIQIEYTLGEMMSVDKWKSYINGLNSSNYFIISNGYDSGDTDIIRTIFPKKYRDIYINTIQSIIAKLEN
jgi:hypothetical protein